MRSCSPVRETAFGPPRDAPARASQHPVTRHLWTASDRHCGWRRLSARFSTRRRTPGRRRIRGGTASSSLKRANASATCCRDERALRDERTFENALQRLRRCAWCARASSAVKVTPGNDLRRRRQHPHHCALRRPVGGPAPAWVAATGAVNLDPAAAGTTVSLPPIDPVVRQGLMQLGRAVNHANALSGPMDRADAVSFLPAAGRQQAPVPTPGAVRARARRRMAGAGRCATTRDGYAGREGRSPSRLESAAVASGGRRRLALGRGCGGVEPSRLARVYRRNGHRPAPRQDGAASRDRGWSRASPVPPSSCSTEPSWTPSRGSGPGALRRLPCRFDVAE